MRMKHTEMYDGVCGIQMKSDFAFHDGVKGTLFRLFCMDLTYKTYCKPFTSWNRFEYPKSRKKCFFGFMVCKLDTKMRIWFCDSKRSEFLTSTYFKTISSWSKLLTICVLFESNMWTLSKTTQFMWTLAFALIPKLSAKTLNAAIEIDKSWSCHER